MRRAVPVLAVAAVFGLLATPASANVESMVNVIGNYLEAGAEAVEFPPPPCESLEDDLDQGRCSLDAKFDAVIANPGEWAKIDELDVRLLGTETADVLTDVGVESPNGVYLIATLEVRNRLSQPVIFDEYGEQVGFQSDIGGDNSYTEDFNAVNGGDEGSFAWQSEELGPGTSQTGTVIFDVPPKVAEKVDEDGRIVVVNYSDVDKSRPHGAMAVLRTYGP